MSWKFGLLSRISKLTKPTIEKLWPYIRNTLKVIYLLHFIPRVFCLTIFSGYDTKCALNENASIFDCTQEFLVSRPKQWILYWLMSSTLSSICLYFICGAYRKVKIRKTCRNVGFCSMMVLFLLTSASFLMRIVNTDPADFALFLALFMWWPSTVGQIIYLNNLDPVTYPRSQPHCRLCDETAPNGEAAFQLRGKSCCHKSNTDTLWFYVIFKLSLITHCMECFALAGAITLDATLALFPVAVIHGDIHGTLIINMSKIFLAIRVIFVYGICFLYLQKIFHGDRTLFAKPGEPLYIQPATFEHVEVKVTNV